MPPGRINQHGVVRTGVCTLASQLKPHAYCKIPDSGSDYTSKRAHDVLDPRVLFEAIRTEILAVAALLEPTMRHLRDKRNVCVDPNTAEVEGARAAQRARVILAPHAGGEAILHSVGHLDGCGFVTKRLDRDHRPEDLLLNHLILLLQAGDNGGLEEEAGPLDCLAARDYASVRGHPSQHGPHPLELRRIVQRPYQHVLVVHGCRRAHLGFRAGLLCKE
mmetsp:Transcript_57146/g.127576  ORF Transcript_57146/g.127576 Transcript_57146/m.127576 type:complete len:219 (+) Transcript_57146:264-920(+)